MSHMKTETTATIRELRTDFRAEKRRIEQHGQVVITDRGRPSYVIRALPVELKSIRRHLIITRD